MAIYNTKGENCVGVLVLSKIDSDCLNGNQHKSSKSSVINLYSRKHG